jgi:hypothetical protein
VTQSVQLSFQSSNQHLKLSESARKQNDVKNEYQAHAQILSLFIETPSELGMGVVESITDLKKPT